MPGVGQLMSAAAMFFSVILFTVCFRMFLADRKERGRKNLKEERLKRRKAKAEQRYGKTNNFINIKNHIISWLKSLRKS